MSEQEQDIEKFKAAIKGKFNHPEAEQLILTFIKIINDESK
jgi:hypothetical protein